MVDDWNTLDILQLQQLYTERSRDLERRLLHGASWQDVHEQRQEVTELAITIYRRLNPASFSQDPASHKGERS